MYRKNQVGVKESGLPKESEMSHVRRTTEKERAARFHGNHLLMGPFPVRLVCVLTQNPSQNQGTKSLGLLQGEPGPTVADPPRGLGVVS